MTAILIANDRCSLVPTWDDIARRADRVRADPGFAAAARQFASGVIDCFAAHRLVSRMIDDAGSYAILTILVAAQGGSGWVPTRDITVIVVTAKLASERRTRRLIARLLDRGLIEAGSDPDDGRVRCLRAEPALLAFFAAWHAAHLAPLARLDCLRGPHLHGSEATAIFWKRIVVRMQRERGFALIDPFPQVAALMRVRHGYLAMLALRLLPRMGAAELARTSGASRSQARIVIELARSLAPETADSWIATELAFAAVVADVYRAGEKRARLQR